MGKGIKRYVKQIMCVVLAAVLSAGSGFISVSAAENPDFAGSAYREIKSTLFDNGHLTVDATNTDGCIQPFGVLIDVAEDYVWEFTFTQISYSTTSDLVRPSLFSAYTGDVGYSAISMSSNSANYISFSPYNDPTNHIKSSGSGKLKLAAGKEYKCVMRFTGGSYYLWINGINYANAAALTLSDSAKTEFEVGFVVYNSEVEISDMHIYRMREAEPNTGDGSRELTDDIYVNTQRFSSGVSYDSGVLNITDASQEGYVTLDSIYFNCESSFVFESSITLNSVLYQTGGLFPFIADISCEHIFSAAMQEELFLLQNEAGTDCNVSDSASSQYAMTRELNRTYNYKLHYSGSQKNISVWLDGIQIIDDAELNISVDRISLGFKVENVVGNVENIRVYEVSEDSYQASENNTNYYKRAEVNRSRFGKNAGIESGTGKVVCVNKDIENYITFDGIAFNADESCVFESDITVTATNFDYGSVRLVIADEYLSNIISVAMFEKRILMLHETVSGSDFGIAQSVGVYSHNRSLNTAYNLKLSYNGITKQLSVYLNDLMIMKNVQLNVDVSKIAFGVKFTKCEGSFENTKIYKTGYDPAVPSRPQNNIDYENSIKVSSGEYWNDQYQIRATEAKYPLGIKMFDKSSFVFSAKLNIESTYGSYSDYNAGLILMDEFDPESYIRMYITASSIGVETVGSSFEVIPAVFTHPESDVYSLDMYYSSGKIYIFLSDIYIGTVSVTECAQRLILGVDAKNLYGAVNGISIYRTTYEPPQKPLSNMDYAEYIESSEGAGYSYQNRILTAVSPDPEIYSFSKAFSSDMAGVYRFGIRLDSAVQSEKPFKFIFGADQDYSSYTSLCLEASRLYFESCDSGDISVTEIPDASLSLNVGQEYDLALMYNDCALTVWIDNEIICQDIKIPELSGEYYGVVFNSDGILEELSVYSTDEDTKPYTVVLNDTQNGTLSCDVSHAKPGETVTVTVTPDNGYKLALDGLSFTIVGNGESYTVISRKNAFSSDGYNTESYSQVEQYSFIMPYSNVLVSAKFAEENYVSIVKTEIGADDHTGSIRFVSRAAVNKEAATVIRCGTMLISKDTMLQSDYSMMYSAYSSGDYMRIYKGLTNGFPFYKGKKIPASVLSDKCENYLEYSCYVENAGQEDMLFSDVIAIAYAEYSDGSICFSEDKSANYNEARKKAEGLKGLKLNSLAYSYLSDEYIEIISGSTPNWVKELSIAEINIATATKEGTYKAAYAVIDHYAEMGVSGIWVTPIHDVGSDASMFVTDGKIIYNGYFTEGPDTLNPQFGTEEDFKAFVSYAHENNIRVFVDVIPHGVSKKSHLVTEHPSWFKTDSSGNLTGTWNMYDFDFTVSECYEWYIQTYVDFALTYGIDGYRCDVEPYVTGTPGSSGYIDIWEQVKQRLSDSGRKIALFSEHGVSSRGGYDFEQIGVGNTNSIETRTESGNYYLNTNIVDAVKNGSNLSSSGRNRFYGYSISNHDSSAYCSYRDSILFGYSVLAPTIPIFYMGEEWKNPSNASLYTTSMDLNYLSQNDYKYYYELAKQYFAIRLKYGEIFANNSAAIRNTNICKVDANCCGIQAYARYADGIGIMIIPNNYNSVRDIVCTVPYSDMGIEVGGQYMITDLLTGESYITSAAQISVTVSSKEMAVISVEPIY